jgi:hypothetical protein
VSVPFGVYCVRFSRKSLDTDNEMYPLFLEMRRADKGNYLRSHVDAHGSDLFKIRNNGRLEIAQISATS